MKGIKILVILALVCWVSAAVSGCNTVRGLGKDIQKGGQAIERVGE